MNQPLNPFIKPADARWLTFVGKKYLPRFFVRDSSHANVSSALILPEAQRSIAMDYSCDCDPADPLTGKGNADAYCKTARPERAAGKGKI